MLATVAIFVSLLHLQNYYKQSDVMDGDVGEYFLATSIKNIVCSGVSCAKLLF